MRLALTLAVLLSACSSPPRSEVDDVIVKPPEAWSDSVSDPEGETRESGDVDLEWWRDLGDPGLNQAVARTLQHNHDIQAAQARIQIAATQARLAGAPLSPTLDVGANATRQRSVFVGLPVGGASPIANTFNNYGVNLNASWELDIWNRIGSAESAALAELQATAEDLRGIRQSLAAQTAKAWFAAVEARQQIALATETVTSFRDTETQIEDRFGRGIRPALDFRLARSQRMAAEAQLHQWRDAYDGVARQLQVLQGRYPDGDAAIPDQLPTLDAPVPIGLPAELVGRRPDLAAAERRLAAAGFRVDEAQAAIYPRLTLSGQIGTTSDSIKDLFDLDFLIWNAAANLVAPLLDGGTRREQRNLTIAIENEAVANFAQVSLNAYREVESLLASAKHIRRQEASLAAAAAESSAARTLSETRYLRGVGEFITVREARRSAIVLEGRRLSIRRLLLDLRVDLHLALGGGFEPEPDKEAEDSSGGPR